jgi:hypothetical protein
VQYLIEVVIVGAADLPARTSRPFAVAALSGTRDAFATSPVEEAQNPYWDEVIEFRSRGSPANDRLRLYVYNRSERVSVKDIVAVAYFSVREIPLGVNSPHAIQLYRSDGRGRPDGSRPAGIFYASFLVRRPDQYQPSPWSVPLFDLDLEFTSAKHIPSVVTPGGRPNPAVFAILSGSQNPQRFKSQPDMGRRNPEWRAGTTFMLMDRFIDSIAVTVFDTDVASGKGHSIGTCQIVASDFKVEREGVRGPFTPRQYELRPFRPDRPQSGPLSVKGRLRRVPEPCLNTDVRMPAPPASLQRTGKRRSARVFDDPMATIAVAPSRSIFASVSTVHTKSQVAERGDDGLGGLSSSSSSDGDRLGEIADEPKREVVRRVVARPKVCQLEWDNLNSTYSTSFTGYSDERYELSNGDGADGHWHPDEDPLMDIHIHAHVLSGEVYSVVGLPSPEEKKYVTVQLIGRKGRSKQKSERGWEFTGPENPKARLKFDFGEVKKGWAIEIAIWKKQDDGEGEKIAAVTKKIKDIELDSSVPIRLTLNDLSHRDTPGGEVSFIAQHSVVA